ncbi:hypothetical protein LOD99_14046 [Oopsacas minuta]|uniref:Hint domain-containing protein n=1 Tax=Oopsacas minuta TaxID=111878 RepID=A0AAV7KKG3_9METZ|nr:hypothetical protein LOD99_14046 [Oopsacas minuta]
MEAPSLNYFHLPSSPVEVNHLVKTDYHRGMRMVQASLNAQRACNEAIIFVYGLTGAGKTSSLNHLFNSEIIPKSKKGTSDTNSVSEYISVMNSPEWEVANLEIGFIDLPGWADTTGDRQDARNLAAIEQFTIGHRHLGSKMYKCYPNIIMLVFNVMDERLGGPESSAAKMLRILYELDIVDIKRPNVVVVLTHAMSIPPVNFAESLRDTERCVKGLTKTYLKVEATVVYLENNASGFLLKKEGEWTVLADGTLQPKNLFDKMMDLMGDCGDEVGIEAVRLYFQNRGSNKPMMKRSISTDCISKTSEDQWRAIIIRNVRKMADTEVVRKIKLYQRGHPELTPDRLLPITFELDKAGFTKKSDFESHNIDDVEERLEPYLLNELEKIILMEVFGVRSRTFPELVNSIGRGYDRSAHKFSNPILKQMKKYYITNGVNVPTCMKAVPLEEFIVSCKYEKYDSTKLDPINISQLHLECKDEEASCHSKLKPVSNWTPLSPVTSEANFFLTDLDTYNFTFTITRSIMNIQLVIYKDLVKLVHDEFIQDINDLPMQFTSHNYEVTDIDNKYHDFFNKYGQYFVLGCDSGGQITGEVHLKCRDTDVVRTKAIIEQYVSTHIATIESTTSKRSDFKFDDELFNMILQTPLTWEGGVKPDFCGNMRDISSAVWHAWVSSLKHKSIILTDIENNLRLIPIYHFASCISKPISDQLKTCISVINPEMQLFDGELYIEENMTIEGTIHSEEYLPRSRTLSVVKHDKSGKVAMTREYASELACTGTSDHSKGGFPGCAKVQKRGLNARPVEVDIKTIKPGDHILCVNSKGDVLYKTVEYMKSEENMQVQYLTLSDEMNRVTIGYKHLVYHGTLTSTTTADNMKLGSTIFYVEKAARVATKARLRNKGYTTEIGNYVPIMEKDGNIIVNGIVCGNPDNCFPGNACVVLKGGDRVRMDELKIGDYVLSIHPTTYKPVYSKVYLWAHRDTHITATFLHITHPHGHIHISANHLILTGDNKRPVPARQLRVGDTIHFLSPPSSSSLSHQQEEEEGKQKERGNSHTLISVPVLHIDTCTHKGYYAPFTNNGLIVVDNIAASVYSHISAHSSNWLWHSVTSGMVHQFGMHRVGQCVLTPVRVGCKLDVGGVLSQLMDTHTHIHKYCQWLLKL